MTVWRDCSVFTSRLGRDGRVSRSRTRGWRPAFGHAVILALASCLLTVGGARAAEDSDERDRPERGMGLLTDYSGVVVPRGETVRMDLTVENKGRRDEDVALELTGIPPGWTAAIKSGAFAVTRVPVASGKTRRLTFSAEPDEGLKPGTYVFTIEGATRDGVLRASQEISVTTREPDGIEEDTLEVTTSYPVLRGQSDARFEFSLDVRNKGDKDRTVSLAAQLPERWEANFKPSFESKYISSLVIPAGQSRTVSLELTPPRDANAGEYPVIVRVGTAEAKAEGQLTVVLTGTYELEARTPTGLLSTEAVTGKPTTVSVLVRNTGSAVNRNVTLTAFKPENWKVEFKPETIETLEPGGFEQVEATIVPAGQALVGDYSVALIANGERASDTVEMRVTVRAPTAWGWIGVGLIIAVIGGLGGLFTWLGRR